MVLLDAVSCDPRITTNIATTKLINYRRGRPHIDIFPVKKHRHCKLSQAWIVKKSFHLEITKYEKLPYTPAPKHSSVAFQPFWSVVFQFAGAAMETPAVECNELNEILTKNNATIFARRATGIRCATDVSSEIRLISIQRCICGYFIFSLYTLSLSLVQYV